MKLRRQTKPDPQAFALQLDFFAPDAASQQHADQPAPTHSPVSAVPPATIVSGSAPTALPPGQRRIQLGPHSLDYRLLRSKRRSIGFLIDDEGLRITAPKWVTLTDIDNAIREKQRWILTKLGDRRDRSARRLQPQMQWSDGATLPYLGGEVTLRIRATHAAGISFDEAARELTIALPADAGEQQLKDRVQGWLQLQAHRIFAERLPLYAEQLGVSFRSFKLSSALTQWGSCTVDGRIRLNWRLVHFAMEQIDYVVAHELAHLREMNHSPRFWATVQSVFPEFQAARKTLRERAPETLPIF